MSPNPLVGAVLARGGEVIGEGIHAELGGLHAERAAIEDAALAATIPRRRSLRRPWSPAPTAGRQPPCTEAILEAEIARVVYASEDPTEKASGRGPGMLRDEGVEVELAEGAEAAAARLLNQPFRKRARTGRPLVTYKAAMSLDGRVAAPSGDSRWISTAESRELVHRWRAECDAVAVGIGTALADDPLLTARIEGAERAADPGRLRLPCAPAPGQRPGRVARRGAAVRGLLAGGADGPARRARRRRRRGDRRSRARPRPRLRAALDELARREIQDLLLEGGPTLAGALFDAGEIDAMRLFVAPLVVGAAGARAVLEGEGHAGSPRGCGPWPSPTSAIGEDLLITAGCGSGRR